MLLNNFIATMYPKMNFTNTDGGIQEPLVFTDKDINSVPCDVYLDTGIFRYSPFFRGIAFGSGTTPPRKQIIN